MSNLYYIRKLAIWQNHDFGLFRHSKIEVLQIAQVLAKPGTQVIIVSAWLKTKNLSVWELKTPQSLRYDTHFKGLSLMLYIIKHITNTSIPLWKKNLGAS